jgi:hypothetical protein
MYVALPFRTVDQAVIEVQAYVRGIQLLGWHLLLARGSYSFSYTCTLRLSTASFRHGGESVSVFYGTTFYLHPSLRRRNICVTLV